MVKVGENIKAISPYKPGKPISEVERELGLTSAIKLASNENPTGISPKVREALINAVSELNYYPDGNAYYLKNAIVEYHKTKGEEIKFEEVFVGNGSNEVIDIAIRTLIKGDEEVVLSEQGFVAYELILKAADIKMNLVPQTKDHVVDIDGLIAAVTPKTKMICLINPNNPTGTYYPKAQFEKLLKAVPQEVILVVDEAYFDFADAPDYPNGFNYRNVHPNMIICRTLSKAFGLSGIRLGYAVSTPEIVDYMNRVREPFNTNLLAQVAGIAAFKDTDYLKNAIKVNKEGKEYLYKEFTRLGIEYLPTQGNFMLFKVGEAQTSGRDCYDYLLHKGVIVRPVANYGFPNWLRLSIGLKEQNETFIKYFEEFLKTIR
ncbi:histidinol-phosphate transaminase [bacterium]|nr:histidinol-phosphate transaminase [bacterium]